MSDILNGIPCVKNISDDIYVGGTDKDTHDFHLKQVFHRLHENGLTINLPKCQFRVPTMLFFGHVFSEKGMSADPKKVEALQNVAPPINASEVRSLLSSAAFCSRFIKDFALITRARLFESRLTKSRISVNFCLLFSTFCRNFLLLIFVFQN